MSFSLRQIDVDDKLCQQECLRVFQDVYGRERLCAVLSQTHSWEERERKLNMLSTLTAVIALSLYPTASQAEVVRTVTAMLQWLWPTTIEPKTMNVTEGAVCYRREQLGIRPLYELFTSVCQPLATPQTTGAFCLGRRVMAIDATLESVADSQSNAAVFGRINSGKTRSPFPQVRCTYLAECGTHAIVAAVLSPCRQHEARKALDLLPAISSQMLVTLDRGIVSGAILSGIRRCRAHALGRLEQHVLTKPARILSDGTYLAFLRVHTPQGWTRLPVRVIEYTLTDTNVPGAGELIRLVTTLLNPRTAPALELIETYHERWEIELTIDEQKTHQCLAGRPLRSQTPQGVVQELYGVLLAHYALRFLMHQAALQADVDPDRLSFTHAVHLVTQALPLLPVLTPDGQQVVMQRLLTQLSQPLLPPRRLRFNARVVKRPFSKFKRKYPVHLHAYELKAVFRSIVRLRILLI